MPLQNTKDTALGINATYFVITEWTVKELDIGSFLVSVRMDGWADARSRQQYRRGVPTSPLVSFRFSWAPPNAFDVSLDIRTQAYAKIKLMGEWADSIDVP